MKENDELSLVELQRILLARCNFSLCVNHKFSMERVLAFSIERIIAFSKERVSCSEPIPAPQKFWHSFAVVFPQRSICVPVIRSLLGYFCRYCKLFDRSLLHMSLNKLELALKNTTSRSRTPVSMYQFDPFLIVYEK